MSEQRIEPASEEWRPQPLPAWAEEVRETACQRALTRLAANDDLDAAQRRTVERASHRLARNVLAGLAGVDPSDDPAAAARLAWLCEPED